MISATRRSYSGNSSRNSSPAVARAARSGATRKKAKVSFGRYRAMGAVVWKVLSAGSLIGGIVAAIWYFNPQEKLQQIAHRPIKEVQVEGSFQFISSDLIEEYVAPHVQDSFLEMNLHDLKRKLESNPWIDTASVARMWPDKLVVRVTEQQPIARWGEKGFLNMRGDIIEVEKTTKIQALPLLHGEDRYAREIMEQYLRIGKLLAQQDLVLAAVELDATRAWTLTTQSGLVIKLGRDRLWEKLQYLLAAKAGDLGKDFHKIELVDMRYPSGFAVTWKNPVEGQYMAGG